MWWSLFRFSVVGMLILFLLVTECILIFEIAQLTQIRHQVLVQDKRSDVVGDTRRQQVQIQCVSKAVSASDSPDILAVDRAQPI